MSAFKKKKKKSLCPVGYCITIPTGKCVRGTHGGRRRSQLAPGGSELQERAQYEKRLRSAGEGAGPGLS